MLTAEEIEEWDMDERYSLAVDLDKLEERLEKAEMQQDELLQALKKIENLGRQSDIKSGAGRSRIMADIARAAIAKVERGE